MGAEEVVLWAHEQEVAPGHRLHLEMKWANVGVGKLYRPYILQLMLLNPSREQRLKADGKADPRLWLPGEHAVSESLELPATLPAGEYILALGLVDPAGHRRPFRLAVDAPESGGRYSVSRLRVR